MARREPGMIALGYGTYVRADRIVMLQPLRGDERGDGARTRVWIEGVTEPVVASRSERAIMIDMGQLERPGRQRRRGEPERPPALF